MIYGLESNNEKRVSMKKSDYEKLPKVRDIIVIDSWRLDSTRGTLIP